jgi:hypothetical protein
VPAMKVTLSAAMRARDVSRPRDEQLADAEAAEASLGSSTPANVSPAGAVRGTDPGDAAREDIGLESAGRGDAERESAGTAGRDEGGPDGAGGRMGRGDGGRRRRVPRDAPRRGRPSQ